MFKKLSVFLIVILVLVVAACAPAEPPAPAAPAAPAKEEAAPAPAKEEAAPAQEEAAPAPAQEEAAASGEKVKLTIESWRNDDLKIWEDQLIPAFNKHYPDIEVIFAPAAPTEYNAALNAKLEGGTAGDLITCRPFDASLALYDQGYLASLNDLPGMENFGDVAKSAWVTDDGANVFCVPMASVIHGFIYNKDIFTELGLEVPKTESEFFAVLDAIKADGNYTPLDMGTADQWEAATMGFQNIGPNYWQGETGRLGLIAGTEKFTDPQYVATWDALAKWAPYLANGYEAQSYSDSQNLFTLGRAAIYPSGSWDITLFNDQGDFEMGAFPPPVPDGADTCYISDHTDIAIGMNAGTKNPDAARKFLEWVTTPEFAELYANALPGFFPLSNGEVTLTDPVAQEFINWRGACESTIRNSYQILSRGEPNLENELWRVSAQVINGALTPADAAQEIQDGLDKWYTPGEAAAKPSDTAVADVGPAKLTIESWRNDDLKIWEDQLIPAFNKHYPDIEVIFAPAAPTEYNAALNAKLEGGTAGDLITCRPFDASLALYDQGYLASLNDLAGMENFGDVAKSAWVTDDGANVFCVPMASVIHGFIYNKDIFTELGLEVPKTESEFFAVLDAIKADGNYTPLDMGTADQWEAATMGFQNIGPNYWKGETGRLGLIAGTEKFTDPQYVATWDALAKWAPYLANGYEAQSYSDSQNLFTLGRAAIYPSGSWDITLFNDQGDFEMGAFPPPVPDGADTCYISDHTDIAIGMNAGTKNPDAARKFLEWVTTPEFAELYANALPGFFPLSNGEVTLTDPVAQEFINWRGTCESTIRNSYQILSRGEPNLENELWRVSAQVMNGKLAPADAAQEIQDGLDKWYTPAK
jgi:raffinose/stachyose/melibiose transport system substrate-binding protein